MPGLWWPGNGLRLMAHDRCWFGKNKQTLVRCDHGVDGREESWQPATVSGSPQLRAETGGGPNRSRRPAFRDDPQAISTRAGRLA